MDGWMDGWMDALVRLIRSDIVKCNKWEFKWELAVAHPKGGSSFTVSGSNWNLEMLVFEERGKTEYPEENLLEQGREPTTNSTHI